MSRFILVLAVLGLFFAPITASANFQQGDKELTLSGTGSSDRDYDDTNFGVDIGVGYFFNTCLEGVLRQTVNYSKIQGDGTNWNGATRIGLDYNFVINRDDPRWRPFLGATVGYIYGDNTKDSFIAGPEGGLKAFVNDTTFIVASVGYDFKFSNNDDLEDDFKDGRWVYNLGLGFRW